MFGTLKTLMQGGFIWQRMVDAAWMPSFSLAELAGRMDRETQLVEVASPFQAHQLDVRIVTDVRQNALKLPNPALRVRLPGVAEPAGPAPGTAAATGPASRISPWPWYCSPSQ